MLIFASLCLVALSCSDCDHKALRQIAANKSRVSLAPAERALQLVVVDQRRVRAELDETLAVDVPSNATLSRRPSWLSDATTLPACAVDEKSELGGAVQWIMEPMSHSSPEAQVRPRIGGVLFLHSDTDAQAAALNAHLVAQQYPSDCGRARLLLYAHWADVGLGSELHWLQVALTAAAIVGRTLVVREDQRWLWAEPSLCANRTLSCFFEPLSSCQALTRAALERLVAPQTLDAVPVRRRSSCWRRSSAH